MDALRFMPCLLAALFGSLQAVASETAVVEAEAAAALVEWKPDTNNGSADLVLCKDREAILRFDVNGMANAASVKARFYCSAHLATTATPIILRVMRDVDWDASSATPNTLKHEIPHWPSTWIGAGDPLYAGAFNITAAGTSYEVDVTSVAKEAARTTGKLALHVYGAWWREQSEWDILQGPGSTVAEQRPQMIAEWADSSRSPAIPDATETLELEPTDDMYNYKGSLSNGSELYVKSYTSESYLKFSSAAFAGRVVSAKLSLWARLGSTKAWDVMLENGGDWSENATSLPPGLTYFNSWWNTPPDDSVRVTGVSTTVANEVDVTDLVKKGQNFTSGCFTLHLNGDWNDTVFYSKDCSDAAKRPKLIVVVRRSVSVSRVGDAVTVTWPSVAGATSYRVSRAGDPEGPFETVARTTGTTAVDATCPGRATYWYRVTAVTADGERTLDTVRFSENTTPRMRAALFDCAVNSGSTSEILSNQASYQVGCQQWDGKTRAMYVCFDPSGLEQSPYVRLRLKTVWANGLNGQNKTARLFGAVTDRFDPEKVCWSNPVFGLPVRAPISSGAYGDDLGRITYDVMAGNFSPYLEFDVTDIVRDAARQGRYATFQISLEAANANYARWIAGVASSYPPVLMYPAEEGFGRLAAEDVLGGEKPTVKLTWSAGPAGTTYTVVRTVTSRHSETTLAGGLAVTEFTDRSTFAEKTVYTVTASLPNGQTAVQSLTHTVPPLKIPAVADGYMFGKESERDASYGTYSSLLVKYDSWGTVNREGVLRFDLRDVPADFKSASVRLRIEHSAAPHAYDKVCFRIADDFEWTDATSPSWRRLLGDQVGSTLESAPGVFATCYPGAVALWADGAEIGADITAPLRVAKAAGQTHLTVHFYPLNGVSDVISFFARESSMSSYAPYLSITPKNWHPRGLTITLR